MAAGEPFDGGDARLRAIAFYLPQFHPISQNDEWWGRGFTEWRNVVRAMPRFPGHYQPHLPLDLGFYDLRLPETREAQANLARENGIYGFCYYHYWFDGHRILERPFEEVLATGRPDFPFCLCWANENWTRVWDGGAKHVLLEQHYSAEDDQAHIVSLMSAFRDPRYIRVDDRPVFLVYRTGLLPDPVQTAKIWRDAARANGLRDLYLVRVESHDDTTDPREIGFDAAIEFAPFNGLRTRYLNPSWVARLLAHLGFLPRGLLEHRLFRYQDIAHAMLARAAPEYRRYHCVTPGWDNTPRRARDGLILLDSTPGHYQHWLSRVAERTRRLPPGEQFVFINAWNEWAEGNHLEPDLRWGRAYLTATRKALQAPIAEAPAAPAATVPVTRQQQIKRLLWRTITWTRQSQTRRLLNHVTLPRWRWRAPDDVSPVVHPEL